MSSGALQMTSFGQICNLFQAFFETSSDVFVEYDANLRCRAINPVGAELWGFAASDMVGKTSQELIEHPELSLPMKLALIQMRTQVEQVRETTEKLLATHAFPTTEGMRFYEFSYTPILSSAGEVVCVFGVGREVTRHQEVHQALGTLQSILNQMPQCLFWKDADLVYQGCNQRWAELVGISDPAEIIGKTDADLPWAVGEAASYQDHDRQIIATGQSELHVLTARLKATGENIWFDACKLPLRNAAGEVVGILCSLEPITKHDRAEQLSQSVQLLQHVLDNIPQSIFWKDRDCVYLGCNKNWAEGAGIQNLADVVGKTDFDMIWGATDAELYREQDRQVMESDTPVLRLLEHRLNADGRKVWIEVNKIPLHDSEDNVIGMLGTIEDITERKQAEVALQESEAQLRQQTQQLKQTLRELRQTQAQLIQTEKMSSLGQLVAGVAHEINNPVNFIHGNLTHAGEYIQDLLNLLQLYQEHHPQPAPAVQTEIEAIDLAFLMQDLPKVLASMRVGTERIRNIVLSLRNFSRMDEAEMKEVDLHEGIDSTLLILQSRLKAKPEHPGIKVLKHYGELPLVECYPGQLNQVFMNVLANAIDALEENFLARNVQPTIEIHTELTIENRVQIRIRDNGSGMPEAVRKRLFDPFFTTKPVGKGTGLGLSISYQIVTEQHRGVLSCRSELGQGSEFWIEIPARQEG